MSPFKSSLARSAGKLFGVFKERDLSLRGATQSLRRGPFFEASGGTTTSAGIDGGDGYRYHVFTSPGTLTISGGLPKTGSILVVGGGGGGASEVGGGGGAGGVYYNTSYTLSTGSNSITVGALTPRGGANSLGANGNNSSLGPITAGGGGGGGECGNPAPQQRGQHGNAGPNGIQGSGGGSTGCPSPGEGGDGANAAGSYPGGSKATGSTAGTGGGGGGSAGTNVPSGNNGGPGGNGRACPHFPAPIISPEIAEPLRSAWTTAVGPTGLYGGGGGGGKYGGTSGTGGPGGGGGGAPNPSGNNTSGDDGVRHTGGGGGGGAPGSGSNPMSLGGDGIVLVRYPI